MLAAIKKWFSRDEHGEPETQEESGPTKHVRLLVMHDRATQPNMKNFCRALEAFEPPSSITVDGELHVNTTEPMNQGYIIKWVQDWLKRGRIVLVCLLCNCNTEFLPNVNKVIKFCFRKPNVQGLYRIVEVDFDQTTRDEISGKLERLGTLIQGGGI